MEIRDVIQCYYSHMFTEVLNIQLYVYVGVGACMRAHVGVRVRGYALFASSSLREAAVLV